MMRSNPWRRGRPAYDERLIPEGLIQEWIQQQYELAARVEKVPYEGLPRFIAGADAAFSPDGTRCVAVAVVWDREQSLLVEHSVARRPVEYPYVPTFLSFREGPALLEAIGQLKHPWAVICFDGQGIAHPRRCGIATHIGVQLDRPAIGVGKSRLCGSFEEPGIEAGAFSPLIHRKQQIGIVLRTKNKVKPLFISVGHRMDIESARRIVMACERGYRLPEPTRQADRLTKVERTRG